MEINSFQGLRNIKQSSHRVALGTNGRSAGNVLGELSYYLLGPKLPDCKMKRDMPWGLMYNINIL